MSKAERESSIEGKSVDLWQADGWVVRKWKAPGHRGVPDRIMFRRWPCEYRACCAPELKKLGETPTEFQADEHEILREAGLDVWVIDSLEKAQELLDFYNKMHEANCTGPYL